MGMRDEILEQPTVVRRILDAQLENVERVAAAVRDRDVEFVYLAARGTSDHAGIYAQYVLGMLLGLPVALAAPSLVSVYGTPPRLDKALVLGISQSGRSPDVVSVIAEGRRQGAPTIALTNDPSSPMAHAAEFNLDVAAGPELAVAATKTYTGQLLALAMLAAALVGDRSEHLAALEMVPFALEGAVATEPEA